MPVFFAKGGVSKRFSDDELQEALKEVFEKLGPRRKVLIVPPDFTRYHSRAGRITELAWEHYGEAVSDIIPALGTHAPVSHYQRSKMFGSVPAELFRVHDWRNSVVTIGEVPADMVVKASSGHLDLPWPAQLNRLAWEGGHDLILSVGQVVPHEVMGMANYNKNLLIGLGGKEAIDLSHFTGAAYGMEKMMGHADNPLRQILNSASEKFLSHLPVVYVLTVVGPDEAGQESSPLVLRGLYVADDISCFNQAAALSVEVNFTLLEEPLAKVVVHLDPEEFQSMWLGNKSIYRTRMAMADSGHLIVLAPGLSRFGEDEAVDKLIRKYGYRGTPEVMAFLTESLELKENLSVAAHLIHGSPEGRFKVTYCPGGLTQEEVEGVGYNYGDLGDMLKLYDPESLQEGWNEVQGELIYFISKPSLGLWATRNRMRKEK
ncbi:unnamed protein product [Chrysoparadoxa australica]